MEDQRIAESALLDAPDLGEDFRVDDIDAEHSCVRLDEPSALAKRGFVSNSAQQLVVQRVLVFVDAATAARGFADARAESSCGPSEFGDADGAPPPVQIPGADEAFSVELIDSLDSAGSTVARRGAVIVVLSARVHHGAGPNDPVSMSDLMTLALPRIG